MKLGAKMIPSSKLSTISQSNVVNSSPSNPIIEIKVSNRSFSLVWESTEVQHTQKSRSTAY